MLLLKIIDLYSLVVLVTVVVSWIRLPPSNPIARLAHAATEPLLGPIRRSLPSTTGLDFAPLVLLIGLRVLKSLLF